MGAPDRFPWLGVILLLACGLFAVGMIIWSLAHP
jgi:hypothetical protein